MTKTVTGTWQFPDGSAVANGTLYLQLTQDANVASTGQVAPRIVQITLDNTGSIPAATVIFANDELTPSGTLYQVAVTQQGGGRVYGPELYSITGVQPISLNSFVPLTSGVFVSVGPKSQQFTTNGTFTIPNGITSVKATVVGAGGAGGGANNTNGGAGGGSGGCSIKWFSGLTPGNTITVTIGTGGTGVSAATGNPGTASGLTSGTQTITPVTANGGAGGPGIGGASGAGGGGGTVGSGGDLNFGGDGAMSIPGTTVQCGSGASSIFGGGANTPAVTGVGNPGIAAGAGGSGALGGASAAGGTGSNGIVIFEWVG